MADFLADMIMSNELNYDPKQKKFIPCTSAFFKLSEGVKKISKKASINFDVNSEFLKTVEWYFQQTFLPADNYMMNRLNMLLFNPYIMSPMVMMYLVSRTSLCSFSKNDQIPLDMVFSQHLRKYNSMLDNPLSEVIISSMESKFYDDEDGIKTNTIIWFNFINSKKRKDEGFIWFNNDQYALNNFENKFFLMSMISKSSYSNVENISYLYNAYRQAGKEFSNSSLRNDLLNLYYSLFDGINADYNLSFYGVGVIPLMVQALYHLVTVDNERICLKNILKSNGSLDSGEDEENLLGSAFKFALSSGSSNLLEERTEVIENNKKILNSLLSI